MELKFYLNKFLKVDNIENYTLSALEELRRVYEKFTDKTEGFDPDFPMMSVGGKDGKGQTIAKGQNNIYRVADEMGEGEKDIEKFKSDLSLGFKEFSDEDNFTLRRNG